MRLMESNPIGHFPLERIISEGPMIAAHTLHTRHWPQQSTVKFLSKEVGFRRRWQRKQDSLTLDERYGCNVRNVTVLNNRRKKQPQESTLERLILGEDEEVFINLYLLTISTFPHTSRNWGDDISVLRQNITRSSDKTINQGQLPASASVLQRDYQMDFKAGGFFSPVNNSISMQGNLPKKQLE